MKSRLVISVERPLDGNPTCYVTAQMVLELDVYLMREAAARGGDLARIVDCLQAKVEIDARKILPGSVTVR